MVSALTIRPATVADAPALASVHVRSWQWAYRGQVPGSYLDQMGQTLAERIDARRAQLEHVPPEYRWWVAEQTGQLVGFAVTRPSEDGDAIPLTAEVLALYLEPEAVGQGIGRALFAHAVTDFRQRGFHQATLWVLESNERARRFYEAVGWAADGGRKTEERPGFLLHEIRYRISL
ncbi:MAG: N-acetyltransferase family protein [Ktedonobacterales bacterium]